jgi:YVTN family beta-propeller protein/autotransporter-associated beta strand protein
METQVGVDDESITPASTDSSRQGGNGPNIAACVFAVIGACVSVPPPCDGQIEVDGYIAGSNAVSVINTTTNTVLRSIPGGGFEVAVTPDGKFAYVANGRVSVINTATNTVLGSPISVGGESSVVAVTPDGKFAYVGSAISLPADEFEGRVSVINTATNTVLGSSFGGNVPAAIAVTPNGKFAYVATNFLFPPTAVPTRGSVSVINTTTNMVVVDSIPVGTPQSGASGIAITPDGKFAYVVTNLLSDFGPLGTGTVSVINTTTNTVVGLPIPVGKRASGIAITPDGKFAYVTNTDSNTVSVINTATNLVLGSIPVGSEPVGVAVTPDGKFAYVANSDSKTVSVINTATNTVVSSIPVGIGPAVFGLSIGPNIIVAPGGPLSIANDAALTALGFGRFVDFNGGTLKNTGDLVTSRTISLLVRGGTIDTNGFNAILSGNIINSGSLTKIGVGALTLSGTNTYSGGTVLDAGTLVVASAEALGLGDVVNGGVLRADPGPINVKGNYHQTAPGTLQLGIGGNAPGQYDFLNVTGHATLGGTLQLISLGGFQPKVGNKFTLVTAGGGLTGKFADVIDPLSAGPGSLVDLVYGTNSLLLEFTNFEAAARTPNQLAVAKQLDNLARNSRETSLISFLASEPAGNLPADFEKISPDSLTALYEISFSAANIQAANLENRFTEIRNHSTGFSSS